MLKIIKQTKNPKYLVITPLKNGDKISKITKKSINRNRHQFDWISYQSNNNIPTNTELALKEYKYIRYIIKIDNDINANRNMLDKMYNVLHTMPKHIAYCYPKFKYLLPNGKSIDFTDNIFNVERLLKSNYITSNSMIDRYKLDEIGGFVTDNKYVRLLDWALWLKFLYYGYIGVPSNTGFVTALNDNNISARGNEDYKEKHKRVYDDFVLPIMNRD